MFGAAASRANSRLSLLASRLNPMELGAPLGGPNPSAPLGAPLGAPFLGPLQWRAFASYHGQDVKSEQLLKKNDEWLIEETNFCLGRVVPVRFKETDDFAHRVLHLMDAQLGKMHTRLRDGTCVPVMGLYIPCITDKPTPLHQCLETPLLKYTWDETYTEAYDN